MSFESHSIRVIRDHITGEGNGNPLQYSCQGKPMDKEAWWAFWSMGLQESDST